MTWPSLATLDGVSLPPQFSYQPYNSKRREIVQQLLLTPLWCRQPLQHRLYTEMGFLLGKCVAAYPSEFKTLYDKYNTATLSLYTFVGYWGETLEVYFSVFDPPDVRGRLFNLGGQFQVISVTVSYPAQVC